MSQQPSSTSSSNHSWRSPDSTRDWTKQNANHRHNRPPRNDKPQRRYSLETSMPSKPIRKITPSYLAIANEEPVTLTSPQKLLVILDLNGTLFHRAKNNVRTVTTRPHLDDFLEFLFKHCRVMVWSSAQPVNVNKMLNHGFGNRISLLDRVWARDMFRLPEQDYVRKVLTVKDLEFIWEGIEEERKVASKEELKQEKLAMVYDQTNTILIDDSTAKIQLQPYNGLALREFDEHRARGGKDDELPKVIKYLEKLIYQKNISAYMRLHPFKSHDDASVLEDLLGNLKLSGKGSKTSDTDKKSETNTAPQSQVGAD